MDWHFSTSVDQPNHRNHHKVFGGALKGFFTTEGTEDAEDCIGKGARSCHLDLQKFRATFEIDLSNKWMASVLAWGRIAR